MQLVIIVTKGAHARLVELARVWSNARASGRTRARPVERARVWSVRARDWSVRASLVRFG